MHALIVFWALSFTLCLVLTPVCRDLFIKFGVLDHPDTNRKLHLRPIPRIGGVPIVVSYCGALLILLLVAPHGASLFVRHSRLLMALLPAAAVIFITGLVDDLLTLKPWQKLAGQFLAGCLAVTLGARLTVVNGHIVSLWISLPLSLFWLIACTNAINLIDGLDGLATGVSLFAAGTTSVVAIVQGNLGLAMATVPLTACLLAFLRYNFTPASVFLGDSGSLTIGFLLGCFSLIWSQSSGSLLGIAAPMMVLALPLLDVGLSIWRRMLRNRPVFEGDRGHIHHMVLALGFSPRGAALVLYGVSALAAFLALLQSFLDYRYRALVILIFVVLTSTGISLLGYVEVSAARRTLSHRKVLRMLKDEIFLQDLKNALRGARTVGECWTILRQACHELNFTSVQMLLHGEAFEATFLTQIHDAVPWTLTVSLGRRGHLVLTRTEVSRSPGLMIAALDHFSQFIHERDGQILSSASEISAASGAA